MHAFMYIQIHNTFTTLDILEQTKKPPSSYYWKMRTWEAVYLKKKTAIFTIIISKNE